MAMASYYRLKFGMLLLLSYRGSLWVLFLEHLMTQDGEAAVGLLSWNLLYQNHFYFSHWNSSSFLKDLSKKGHPKLNALPCYDNYLHELDSSIHIISHSTATNTSLNTTKSTVQLTFHMWHTHTWSCHHQRSLHHRSMWFLPQLPSLAGLWHKLYHGQWIQTTVRK